MRQKNIQKIMPKNLSIYRIVIKRLIDFIISLGLLIILLPLLIFLCILLILQNEGNPFFIQSRPGKGQRIMKIVKFKSMTNEKDQNGVLLQDVERITPLGKFIRKWSLDELPQLFNVLIGDMSLVGPRPLLIKYLPLYSKEQMRRHDVKPGITGWAQVNGRNKISWSEKLSLDIWYVDHLTFWLDLKILFLTMKRVLLKDGINSNQDLTMPPFTGNN